MKGSQPEYFPHLDTKIAKKIDAYSMDDLSPNYWQSGAGKVGEIAKQRFEAHTNFRYGFIENGVDSVVNASVLLLLRKHRESSAPLRKFIEKLELSFGEGRRYHFSVPFHAIEREGLYIPRARKEHLSATQDDDRTRVALFNSHHGGMVEEDSWIDKEYGISVNYPFEVTDRNWRPYDLENPRLIQLSERLVQEWWKKSMNNFESYSKKEQDPKITRLGAQLRDYYQGIMNMCKEGAH